MAAYQELIERFNQVKARVQEIIERNADSMDMEFTLRLAYTRELETACKLNRDGYLFINWVNSLDYWQNRLAQNPNEERSQNAVKHSTRQIEIFTEMLERDLAELADLDALGPKSAIRTDICFYSEVVVVIVVMVTLMIMLLF